MPDSPPLVVHRVLAKLEPGGAQLSALRVVRGLRAQGIGSRVLAGWASPEGLALAARMGVAVEVYGEGGELQWCADQGFAAWLAERLRGAHVVHAHMFGGWWAAAQAVDADVPLIASEHNALLWPGPSADAALREALPRVDRFYAHGPGARETLLAAGLDPARVRAGLSPIATPRGRARRRLPRRRLVFAGRLHREKGPDVLLDALALLPAAPPLFVLGAGPLLEHLEAQTLRLGLGDRVQFAGWQPQPERFLAGATALVVPSRDESWSQIAVLAMALGVPVIGTDVDGLPDTLAGGRGLIVPPEDPPALAAALADLLAGRRCTDLAAARRYAAGFAIERVAARYAESYRELAGSGRDAAPATVGVG